VFAFSRLVRPGSRVDIRRRHLRFEPQLMRRLVALSSSATFQSLVATGSWVALIRILSTFGSNAMAGYTIALRIVVFALLPSWGLSNAAATMVGQALGAKKPERAERAVWLSGSYSMAFLGTVSVVFVVFAHTIVGWFARDPAVLVYGADALRIVSYGYVFYAWEMVFAEAFNGEGDTLTPTLMNVFVFWCLELPLAYVLGVRLGWGPRGVFVSVTVAFSAFAVLGAVLFRAGRWKTRVV
jgi:Na+-driven multidrug efflux pump